MDTKTLSSSRKNVVTLEHEDASCHAVAGGKGANLAKLFQRGYPVPPAFVVTTQAYAQFLDESGLKARISGLLGAIVVDNIESLETQTTAIRALIESATIPTSIGDDLRSAYRAMSATDHYVAVRSSGTAEDLAGTSFAGLHDTYLDVLGTEELIDATLRCWASLWTARAVGYRQRNGFDHFEAQLAVVVQKMVAADVAGVMFTANPRTAATDETLINATWGLGESLVQGIITPDEFVVHAATAQALERAIGAKEKQIVRNPESGRGVVTQDVAPARRQAATLTDAQLAELTHMGRRITADYDGYPQDIEWAIEDGTLYLLQSRPITGLEFSWDADIDDSCQCADYDPTATWTRAMSDEVWTGAITPLYYSWNLRSWNTFHHHAELLGRKDLQQHRLMKYHRGTAYWNCEFQKSYGFELVLPFSRAPSLPYLPETWHREAMATPFGMFDYIKQYARIFQVEPGFGPYAWIKGYEHFLSHRMEEIKGPGNERLRQLSDDELQRYLRKCEDFQAEYSDVVIFGLCYYYRDALCALMWVLQHWYDGGNQNIFADLMTGTPKVTITISEHIDLAHIAKLIRDNPRLLKNFEAQRDGAFFDQLRRDAEGAEVVKAINAFLDSSGHRGQSDRDPYFARYADDPSVLYNALEVHLKSHDDPMEMWERNHQVRNAARDDVLKNFSRQAFGFLKVEAFKIIHDYVMMVTELRDNERHYVDRSIYTMKNGFLELNRRLKERGVFDNDRDFFMLAQNELFDVLHGTANMTLIRHKIAGRWANWDRFDRKEAKLPKFLQRNAGLAEEIKSSRDAEGRLVLRGFGTSRGEVTATARVIKNLKEIGRVNKGEIMIANSTDPGWTPVFAALAGVIVETGGILSHSGCLAREYGLPAAHIENAVTLIPDGAMISLNGESGTVVVLQT